MDNKNLDYYMNLKYEVVVEPADEDGFVVYIPDLPGCITQVETKEEILPMILDAKKCWISSALADGEEVPLPKKLIDFSGKFSLRLPKSLHQRLFMQAKRENVSINQLVISYIATCLNHPLT